ncbi:MAG TPA: hypothetical protein VKM94_11960 [Blastocatellia bacterium]|nr:hypothetical protein [Blastocatellia bacterium]
MSAKLTIIFFILICFEIGLLLLLLPWVPMAGWNDNYLLVLAADRMHLSPLANIVRSGFVRGAVSGLGLLNILLGIWEIINFKKTAHAFQLEWQSEPSINPIPAVAIRDNRPEASERSGSDQSAS